MHLDGNADGAGISDERIGLEMERLQLERERLERERERADRETGLDAKAARRVTMLTAAVMAAAGLIAGFLLGMQTSEFLRKSDDERALKEAISAIPEEIGTQDGPTGGVPAAIKIR